MDKIHIGILGAGKIGMAIYNLLVASGSGYNITVADKNVNDSDFQQLELHPDTRMYCLRKRTHSLMSL